MLEQARLDQQNGQFNASLNQQIAIAQANLKAQVDQFNTNWSNQANESAKNREIQKLQIAASIPPSQESNTNWWQVGGAVLGGVAGGILAAPTGGLSIPVGVGLGSALGGTVGGAIGNNNAGDEAERRRREQLERLGLA
jgi:uncharacterized protein YcfJ